jgi:hypothetical protein
MHHCTECGQACYCHGDIDDCVVETEEYSYLNCTCPCEENDGDDGDDFDPDDADRRQQTADGPVAVRATPFGPPL